ncbi:MAG: transposase [Halioglobus sp.]|nr:transposase [Halioglobus sp.]
MDLATVFERYQERFLASHVSTLTADQWSACHAIVGCRTGQYGELALACQDCHRPGTRFCSCGHRACNQCHQEAAQQWLARQQQKLLPVPYYLVTFTLPFELRELARRHPRTVYALLMRCAAETLRRFGRNKKDFAAELGLCAVLHTHARRLDYHPHVHIVVPGDGVHRARREWRGLKGGYLFNGRALAAAFRGAFLHALAASGLTPPSTPRRWVVHCKQAGRGLQALQYLSRYLYRGVISDRNLLADDGERITFRYKDSRSHRWQTRTLAGEDFVALVLQHVLPKGFRRARDYGFLHGNARALLRIVQWVLRTPVPEPLRTANAVFTCPHCRGRMQVCGVRRRWEPG